MKIKKILPWCLIIVLVMIVTVQYIILLSHDISSQALYVYPANKPKVYLMSYADGDEIYFRNQNALNESSINKGIDFVFSYRSEHLDPAFVAKNADILAQKKGVGYWLWKPWLILQTLNNMPEDAILIYSDVNYVFIRPVLDLINLMQSTDILILQHPSFTREQESQRATLDGMGCTSKECRQGLNELSGFLILKNTPTSRAFIKEWLAACEVKEYLLDNVQDGKPEYSCLVEHKPDQAILGILAFKHREKIKLLTYRFARENYILNTYRKAGSDYLTKDADIFKYSYAGRLQYKLSNSYPFVKLREFMLTTLPHFPWRDKYYKQMDLSQIAFSPAEG